MGWREVEAAFVQAIERQVFPGATILVRKGGVAGHAGLFVQVREADRITREFIDCYKARSSFIPQKIVREFRPQTHDLVMEALEGA